MWGCNLVGGWKPLLSPDLGLLFPWGSWGLPGKQVPVLNASKPLGSSTDFLPKPHSAPGVRLGAIPVSNTVCFSLHTCLVRTLLHTTY
jgi:hypothetical protein